MARTSLNTEGESSAHALIRAGHYDSTSAWSFSAEDGDKLLGPKGDDWAKYGRWHLGEDPSEPEDTKAHWKYPYGKDGKVYRRAVAAIRQRASQNGDSSIYDAAGKLMSAMDDEDGKKEQSGMSGLSLSKVLGSRFGHFAAARSKPDDDAPDDDGDDAAKRAKKAEDDGDDEEMKRAARRKEDDEDEARRARRARGARKGRRAKDGDDDDDAADDDEDEEDEEEMRRAHSAGHDLALEAAFRAGARAQRRRCAKIFEAKAAALNPALACSLAFKTSMTSTTAVAVLEETPAAARNTLADRMAFSGVAAVRVGPGAAEAPHGPAAIAASWDHVMKALTPVPAAR